MDTMEPRRKLLREIRDTDRELKRIYEQAAEDLSAKAARAKPGGLTRRWQLELKRSVRQRMREIGGAVEGRITSASRTASNLPVKSMVDWLDTALRRTGKMGPDTSFKTVFARTSDEALEQIIQGRAYLDGKSLSRRIWSRIGRQEEGINHLLEQAVAQKKSARELAKELHAYLSPSVKDTPDASWYAQRLARTSIKHAYDLAGREAAARNPFCTAMHWALSPEHFSRQVLPHGTDICDEYAAHDEGLGVGNWPPRAMPLGHACCLCYQYPVVPQSLDDCARELGAWLDGGENAKLDEAFGGWRNELVGRARGQGAAMLADDRVAERRAELLNQIAARPDVQAMGSKERQAYFDRLTDASTADLEAQFRAAYDRGQPMDAAQRDRIIDNLRRKGVDVRMDAESESYLDWREKGMGTKIDACTFGDDLVLLRQSPTASELLEESIHIHQNRTRKYADMPTNEADARKEIEAAEILLKNASKYGITEVETKQTEMRLKSERKRLKKILEEREAR